MSVVDVATIVETLRGVAPPELAESWDNTGLLLGDTSRPVERVQRIRAPRQALVGLQPRGQRVGLVRDERERKVGEGPHPRRADLLARGIDRREVRGRNGSVQVVRADVELVPPEVAPQVPTLVAAEFPILAVEATLAALASFTLVVPLGLPWWLEAPAIVPFTTPPGAGSTDAPVVPPSRTQASFSGGVA